MKSLHGGGHPLLPLLLVLLSAASAAAEPKARLTTSPAVSLAAEKPKAKPRQKPPGKPFGFVLARHLDQAIGIDAQSAALEAQRRAVAARYAQANSFTPGSPYFGGSRQERVKGNVQGYRESELEIGMPIWLPGEREAYEVNVTAGVAELDERLALRRLDVAALVRDAWWTAQRTAKEAAVARDRLATARDIGNDMKRRVELGENAAQDELLSRNEILAAETEVAQTEAAAKAARAAYAVLTGGATPDGTLEAPLPARPVEDHPALRAPLAAVAKSQTQKRLIETGFIDHPEISVFGRNEQGTEPAKEDPIRSHNNTVGVRFRIPLPTPGRNVPRLAEAQAEVDRANAEFDRAQRLVAAEINAARVAVTAAKRADALAAKRLAVANEQFELARRSFRLGEINAFDLYRVRQLQIDAARARASAAIDLGVALSRLNQAFGYAPTL